MGNYYYQCLLEKKDIDKDNNVYIKQDISWIPEKYAVVGKELKIKKDVRVSFYEEIINGYVWDLGWKVIEIYGKEDKSSVVLDGCLLVYEESIEVNKWKILKI
jgi:hypothetical protein